MALVTPKSFLASPISRRRRSCRQLWRFGSGIWWPCCAGLFLCSSSESRPTRGFQCWTGRLPGWSLRTNLLQECRWTCLMPLLQRWTRGRTIWWRGLSIYSFLGCRLIRLRVVPCHRIHQRHRCVRYRQWRRMRNEECWVLLLTSTLR